MGPKAELDFDIINLGMRKSTLTKKLILNIYQNPHYRGKHIVAIAGKVFTTKTGKAKTALLDKLLKKYPKETPIITYIPKVDSLVLIEL